MNYPLDRRLLRSVRTHLLAHPERCCAAQWAWARNVQAVLAEGAAPEQFRCCIAGHVLLLSGRYTEAALLHASVHHDDGFLGRQARDVLGLSAAQHRELFYPAQWADPFRSRYYLTATPAAEATVCADFIDHFLSKHAPAWAGADDRMPVAHAQHVTGAPHTTSAPPRGVPRQVEQER